METLMDQVLVYLKKKACGVAWDMLKRAGNKLIDNFCLKFLDWKYFQTEEDAQNFLKEICSSTGLQKLKKPLNHVRTLYVEAGGDEARTTEFVEDFSEWVKENEPALHNLAQEFAGMTNIHINDSFVVGHQKAGTIINIKGQ